MPVGNEQVLPSVVVIIEEAVAESNKRNGGCFDSNLVADIGESPAAVVMKDDVIVVTKRGADDVEVSVVLVITHGESHVRDFASIPIEGKAAV